MEIRNLRTLLKIAELGSFTKAAQSLGYAQSTLTFQVQAIEAHYGRPVFEKPGKNLRLTAFGAQLLEHVHTVLLEYDTLEQLNALDTVPQGSIRIGAPESLMMYRLYPIIKAYKSAYPQVEISVVNSQCEQLLEDLSAGQLDISFFLQPEYSHQRLHVDLLQEEVMCLVAPAGHARDDLLPEATQMVLYTEKECSYRQEFDRYLQKCQYHPTNLLETSSVEAIKKYVLNGLGVSYLPYYAVREEAEKGLLRVAFLQTDLRFYTQIAYHEKKWLSPAIQALLDLSRAHSKQWEATARLPQP